MICTWGTLVTRQDFTVLLVSGVLSGALLALRIRHRMILPFLVMLAGTAVILILVVQNQGQGC